MGDFVQMMADNNWIEGSLGPTKSPGAYCTNFAKSRTPRVYMCYSGTLANIQTLAHELGHAFHSWVMKDMAYEETFYPMTLAESASIFGETILQDELEQASKDKWQRLESNWQEVSSAAAILLNIMARFDFEHEVYQKRRTSVFSPEDYKTMMAKAWENNYGDAVESMDSMLWASKLHFYLSGISFYNFPYIFGYLFSLGIYAQKDNLGENFYSTYINLLKDSGRMTAEEVAKKHLTQDLTDTKFWDESLKIVEQKLQKFEASVEECF